MTAQTILKLIEKATAEDTALLDEIDARTWCYVRGYEYLGCRYKEMFDYKCDKGNRYCNIGIPYTRCRGALKVIRPEGTISWNFMDGYETGSRARCEIFMPPHHKEVYQSDWMPTEELAELWCIIQAIEHDRKAKTGE